MLTIGPIQQIQVPQVLQVQMDQVPERERIRKGLVTKKEETIFHLKINQVQREEKQN